MHIRSRKQTLFFFFFTQNLRGSTAKVIVHGVRLLYCHKVFGFLAVFLRWEVQVDMEKEKQEAKGGELRAGHLT